MKKILRRRCIIRQYDFLKVKARDPHNILYDSYEFTPFTKIKLDQDAMWYTLKGKKDPAQWLIENPPRSNIRRLQEYLYDKRYLDWYSWYDDEGDVCIQARKNTPISYLGWATFIKEYDTNT